MKSLRKLLTGEIETENENLVSTSIIKAISDEGNPHYWQISRVGQEKVEVVANYKVDNSFRMFSKELDKEEFRKALESGEIEVVENNPEKISGILQHNELEKL